MKILHVMPPYFDIKPDGAMPAIVHQTLKLAAAQEALGHTVYFIGPKGSQVNDRHFIQTETEISKDYSEAGQKPYFDEVMAWAEKNNIDIVHNHISKVREDWPPLEGNIPVLHSVRSSVDPKSQRAMHLTRQQRNLNINWISEGQKAVSKGDASDPVIYHGVDAHTYQLGLPDKRTNDLLFVGRITPAKGLHLAVQAARDLDLPLTIIGPIKNQRYFDTQIKPYLSDKIKYLGEKPQAETIHYFQTHKVLVNPLQWDEAFGLTMVEAPLCGCSVVAYDRGSVSELIQDGKNGFAVTPDDYEGLKKAIVKATELDPSTARETSLKFSLKENAQHYLDAYERIIKGQQKKKPVVWVVDSPYTGVLNSLLGVASKLTDDPNGVKIVPLHSSKKFSVAPATASDGGDVGDDGFDIPNETAIRFDTKAWLTQLRSQQPELFRDGWPDVILGVNTIKASKILLETKDLAASGKFFTDLEPKKPFITSLMPPKYRPEAFDLIVNYKHKAPYFGDNVITVDGVPNLIDDHALEKGRREWADEFSELKKASKVTYGVILGGDIADRKIFTVDHARELARRVKEAALKNQGSVIVTTSRRTSQEASKAFFDELTDDGRNEIPCYFHDWRLSSDRNPYFGILDTSDYIIATADSMSMCSEAASTGKPVYVYYDDSIMEHSHKELIDSLAEQGKVRLLPKDGEAITRYCYAPLNAGQDAANEILDRMQHRQSGHSQSWISQASTSKTSTSLMM